MKTAGEINAAILSSKLSNDDINSIVQAIKYARAQITRQVKRSITVGTQVQFTDRGGYPTQGVVTKVAVKYATVKVGHMNWRVPMNMLTTV